MIHFPSQRYLAKQGRTPEIQASAEAKVQNAMTDRFTQRIQKQAQADARTDTYMSPQYIQMMKDHMRQTVSPERAQPIAQTQAVLEQAKDQDPYWKLVEALLDRAAGHTSMEVHSRPDGQTAEVFSPEGEVIASYNSLGSGWQSRQTKAETKFYSETAAVYAQAFREARQEQAAPTRSLDLHV